MKVHAGVLAAVALFATLGLVAAQDRPAQVPALASPEAAPAAAPQERETDVRAIGEVLASFVKAYNEKDAKAVGALFTADAEIEDEDGSVTRGRDAIVERFSGIFKEGKSNKRRLPRPHLARPGARGPAVQPVPPPRGDRRRRDGRGLPRRASAAEAPLRHQSDPPGAGPRPPLARTLTPY